MPSKRIPPRLALFVGVLAAVAGVAPALHAEGQQTAPPDVLMRTPTRSLEVIAGTQQLTDNFSNWRTLTLHGIYENGDHVFQGELSAKREFDMNGRFFGFTDTYTINSDWFTTASVGFGDGAFYLPRYRVDGFLYRKWLAKKNLVSSIGAGYYSAPDGHIDRSFSVGGAYYFEQPVVTEMGVRFNRSSPGGVNSHQQFVALSWNPGPTDTLTARVAWGSEGYAPLTESASLVGFQSHEQSVGWRHMLERNWGVSLAANRYSNPSYKRHGIDVGIQHQFD